MASENNGQRGFTRYQLVLVGVFLVAWAVITVPLSYWPGGSIDVLTEHYMKAVAFFWLICTVVTSAARVQTLAWTFVLCSIPLAATGLRSAEPGVGRCVPNFTRSADQTAGRSFSTNPAPKRPSMRDTSSLLVSASFQSGSSRSESCRRTRVVAS